MSKQYGHKFRMIRQERGLSTKYVAANIISVAGLSKFERDEGSISIDRLVQLLDRMNVSMTEFLNRVDNYHGGQSVNLYNKLSKLIMHKDVAGIINLRRAELVAIEDNNDIHDQHRLNSIALECAIALVQDKEPATAHVKVAIDYLRDVDNWMQFDMRVAGVILTFVDDDTLRWFADSLFKRVYDTQRLVDNGFRAGEVGLNILALFLERGLLDDALDTINRLQDSSLPHYLVAFAFRFESLKAIYQYLQGNRDRAERTFQLIDNSMTWMKLTESLKFLIVQRKSIINTNEQRPSK
jgi:transcriptional regulator with XRE-family HTH domain